jgi:dUTP pyrophosphatase
MDEPRSSATDTGVTVRVGLRRLPHAAGIAPPAYESAGAAGLDVRAAVDADVTIAPGAIARVPTGFAVELPAGWELQIRPRSGLSAKHGITLVNSPATIDSDYRGEVFVALVNHGDEPFVVVRGMRIAQVVPARTPRLEWVEMGELSGTARGAGGFGHTGTT